MKPVFQDPQRGGRDSGAAAFAGFLEHSPDIIKQYRGEEKKLAQTVWGVSLIYR